jgi:hypothetical protein
MLAPSSTQRPLLHRANQDDDDRKRFLSQAIYGGNRIPSVAMLPKEFFVTTHHGIFRAISQARGLNASQLRYVLCVLEFSPWEEQPGYVVIRSGRGKKFRLPTIHDWSRWLGDMTLQQIYTIRRQLHALGIIRFVDDDPDKIAFNSRWETWHPAVFTMRAARAGAGRRCKAQEDLEASATTIPAKIGHSAQDGDDEGNGASEDDPVADFFDPQPQIHRFADDKSVDLEQQINEFGAMATQPAPQATSAAHPKKRKKNDLRKRRTPATAGAAHSATAEPADASLADEIEKDDEGFPSQAIRTSAGTDAHSSHPPHSARPPRSALPERLVGETLRAYWTRALHLADPASKRNQRAVVHAAARDVLGMELNRADLRLLGQLRRKSTSWGTVLHWVLKSADVAAADIHAYLCGFLQHEEHAHSTPKRDFFPPTEDAQTPTDEEASAHEVGGEPDVLTTEDETWALASRLRGQEAWRDLGLDGMPPDVRQQHLLQLVEVQHQGAWTLQEYLVVVRSAVRATVPYSTRHEERWQAVRSDLARRAQARSVTTPATPAVATAEIVVSPASQALEPALVSQRAHALRKLCGAGTELGQEILAFVDLDERDALESAAATLLELGISPDLDGIIVRDAWDQVRRRGITMDSHTVSQRRHHWGTHVTIAARTIQRRVQGNVLTLPC